MFPGRKKWTVMVVAAVLIVAVVAYGVVAVDRPRVESVDSEWGTVTSDRTEVETRIGIDDPLLLRVGDRATDVSYTVSLNDVEVATERKERVDAAGRAGTVTLSTWIDNDDVPVWWATHINRNETTTVRIEPSVVVDYAGVRIPATEWTQTNTVRTDLLEPLRSTERREFRVADRTAFVVEETDATWGNATANRTPIDASATVTNPNPIPVPITEISYTIRVNDIVVGEGVAGEQIVLPADSTRTLEAGAAIDTDELDEWWVTHLRNDETSTLTVDFTATLQYGGVERTVPLEFMSYERTIRTDVLGSADVEAVDAPADREPNRTRNGGGETDSAARSRTQIRR